MIKTIENIIERYNNKNSKCSIIDYNRYHSKWDKMEFLCSEKLIRKSMKKLNHFSCLECNDRVEIINRSSKFFYQCVKCGDCKHFTEEQITTYQTSLYDIASFLHSKIGFDGSIQNIKPDRVMLLGTKELNSMNFKIYAVRGLNWNDTEQILNLCKPTASNSPNSIVISLYDNEIDAKNNRILSFPLSPLLLFSDNGLDLNTNYIEMQLIKIFEGGSYALKQAGLRACKDWFISEIEQGNIVYGKQQYYNEQAKNRFGVARDIFLKEVWIYAPEEATRSRGKNSK